MNFEDFNVQTGMTITKQQSNDAEVSVGGSGADQAWDFSGQELELEYLEFTVEPEGRPGWESFPDANFCSYAEAQPGTWEVNAYVQFNENFSNYLGMAAYIPQMDTTYVGVVIENIGNWMDFPVNFGDEWDNIYSFEFGGEVSVDSVHYVVDSWGTLTDVAGQFDCLRIQKFVVSTNPDGERETNWGYQWVTPEWGVILTIDSQDNEENPDFAIGDIVRTVGIEQTGVSRSVNPAIPNLSSLDPAYPNPFNPVTKLQFNVSNPGVVSLKVYNTNGRIISDLVSGYHTPGQFQIPFKADNLNPGVYYAKFNSGGISQTQKLILVK